MANSPGRILIIDDTADIVELLRKRFQADGYTTAEAYDGEQGLAAVENFRPDLIVLDIMMPKIDGLECCRRLRAGESTRYIPILMLTAKSGVPDRIKGLDIGADDYITKPFNYRELAARVRSLLARKAASERLIGEERLEALETMVQEVAHEIRNPLVSIGGFARRIYKALPDSDPNRKYLEIILEDVVALERMVKQLVELKSAVLSYMEPSNMHEVIERALESFSQMLAKHGVTVRRRLMADPPQVSADRQNMERVIGHLIENAVEAMAARGEKVLEITTLVQEGCFEIRIADTGKGISRDQIKNIYEPFYTSKTYGPGLGLTFALKTVQSHKGMIAVESTENVGTTFTVRLPLRQRPSCLTGSAGASVAPGREESLEENSATGSEFGILTDKGNRP